MALGLIKGIDLEYLLSLLIFSSCYFHAKNGDNFWLTLADDPFIY